MRRSTAHAAAGLLLVAAAALACCAAAQPPADPTMRFVDIANWPGTQDRDIDPPGYPTPQQDDGAAAEAGGVAPAAASRGNCPANYYHDPRFGPRNRCWCKPGWAPYVPGWTANKRYPTKPPVTCKNVWFDGRSDKPYDPKATYPDGRGPCACFPCPPGYSSFGVMHMNSSLGGCQRVNSFYVVYNFKTKGKVCDDKVWKPVRVPLLNVTRATAGFLNVKAPENVVANMSVANRYYIRAYKVFCKETFDPPYVKGVRKYAVAIRYAYIGKPDVATRVVAKANKILPESAKAKGQALGGEVEAAAAGSCAYGICDIAAQASSGTVTVESIAAQTTPFDVPIDPQMVCTPPACNDRPCSKGTCLTQYGQCEYTPVADGTSCSTGSVTGTCQAGECSGMAASIKQAVVGQTESVAFTVQFPLPVDAVAGRQVFVYSSSSTGSIEPKQWGELYDDGDPSHFDAVAGDGVFSNALPITFTQQGTAFFAGVLLGESVSPLPLTSINVIRSGDVPSFETMNRTQAALSGMQRYVDIQAGSSTGKSGAIDKLINIMLQGGSDGIDTSLIDLDSITRTSDRSVSFTMQPGSLPCIIIAGSPDESRTCAAFPGARRRLLAGDDDDGDGSSSLVPLLAGAAAPHPWRPRHTSARRSLHQQACPNAKGTVLVLAPYFANFKCKDLDESDKVVEVYRKAGYEVIFKCNSPVHCPAGPPTMEDFTKLSAHAAVFVSTVGHSSDSGSDPLLLTRAPLPLVASGLVNPRFAADWASGRAVMVGSGGFALAPGWFQKHGSAPAGVNHAGTVLHFAADRSARAGGAQGFANAIRGGVPMAASFSGYTDWLARAFSPAGPGTRMASYLAAREPVDNMPSEGTTDSTGARFRAFTFVPGGELQDKCDFVCKAVACEPTTCPSGGQQGGCNSLTGTCDTSCCDKADGDGCTVRGMPSKCSQGRCQDLCPAAICSSTPCKKTTSSSMSLCDPLTGGCATENLPDGTLCQFFGSRQGACTNGTCSDVCKNVKCNPAPCQVGTCNPTSGVCEYTPRDDGTECPLLGVTASGTCKGGTCLPFSKRCVNYVPLTGINQFVWGDGRGGTPMFTTPPAVVSDCLPEGLALGVYPRASPCEGTTDLLVTGKGMWFMRCFTYSIDGSTNTAALGPAVELEPLEAFNGREVRLTALQMGEAVNNVEDCAPDFSITLSNSAANATLSLPCWLSANTLYEFPGAGVPIPVGERTLMEFVNMSPQHIFAVQRLHYIIL